METDSGSIDLRALPKPQETSGRPSSELPADPLAAKPCIIDEAEFPKMRPWRFWAILTALSFTGTMSALEGTIITSALPTIAETLGGGDLYIWVPNAYLLAQVAVLPLTAQASNVFGRRNLLLGAVLLFTLGSALCGAASSMAMLIASRTIQGLGGGGIILLVETVVTDIVSLRERGKFMSIVMAGATVGATLGPFLGGLITERSTWRWCFYINVPFGVTAFIALFFFLKVKHDRKLTFLQRLKRIDIFGNAIFIGSIVSVLLAITWGGTLYSWSGYQIVVPLVFGLLGILLFTAVEWSPKICPEPSFPRKIVSNRTSATALLLTFLHAIIVYWVYYFLPIYFQAVKGLSPMRSGINTLPTFAGGLIFTLVGGIILSKFGRYKPLHLFGFATNIIAFGLFSLLDVDSPDAAWVCFQILAALGGGGLVGVLLPAVQAPLDDSYNATATGVWTFARYFGCVWGVTIPSAIFNNECRRLASAITDKAISVLVRDHAYQHATGAFIDSLEDPTIRAEVIGVFTGAMRTVWLIAIAFAGLGFLLTFVEKEIDLRTEVATEFGIEEKDK